MRNNELVLKALSGGGRLTIKQIGEWIDRSDHSPLNPGQINSALQGLKKDKKVRNVDRAWDLVDKPNRDRASRTSKQGDGPLIPCYGMSWLRDQISWDNKPNLLGKDDDGSGESVNFASQRGVYVLYEWPNVTYVGQTDGDGDVQGRLYKRLREHTVNEKRRSWDRFSWFGLLSVDANQELVSRREDLDVTQAITAMETLLIAVLSPPLNNQNGNLLGTRYYQVPDDVIESRRREDIADQIMKLLDARRRR